MTAQIISALIFYALVLGILIVVFLMWRESINRARRFDAALLEAARLSAESARSAADAAKAIAAHLERLPPHA